MLAGHVDEVSLQQLVDRATVLRVYLQGHQHKFLELFRDIEPDGFLEIKELLVSLICNATGNQNVQHGADRPHVTLRPHLVGLQLWGKEDAIYARDERDTALVLSLSNEHGADIRQLDSDVGVALKSVFD